MQRSLFFLLIGSPNLLSAIPAQTVNGLPPCANECALDFIKTQNCPLVNTTCICDYLSFYATCVDRNCNTTADSAAAITPPAPYYIPNLTISIESAASSSCPASPASNPVFGTTRATSLPRPTGSEFKQSGPSLASATVTESPSSTTPTEGSSSSEISEKETGGKIGESTTSLAQTKIGSKTTQTGTSQSRSVNITMTIRESGESALAISSTAGLAKVTGTSGSERLNIDLMWTWIINAALF